MPQWIKYSVTRLTPHLYNCSQHMLKVEPIASVTIYSYTFASLSVDLLQSSLLVDIQIAT